MLKYCQLLAFVLVLVGPHKEPGLVGVWETTTPKDTTVIYEFNADNSIVWTTLDGDARFVIKGTYAVDFEQTPVTLDLFDFELLEYPDDATPPPAFEEWHLLGIIEFRGADVLRMTGELEREGRERPRDFSGEVIEFKRVQGK